VLKIHLPRRQNKIRERKFRAHILLRHVRLYLSTQFNAGGWSNQEEEFKPSPAKITSSSDFFNVRVLLSCRSTQNRPSVYSILQTYLVDFLFDELVLLAACKFLTALRVRHLEFVALLLGDAKLCFRLPRLGLVGLIGLHRRVQLVQHPEYLLMRLVTDLATLQQVFANNIWKIRKQYMKRILHTKIVGSTKHLVLYCQINFLIRITKFFSLHTKYCKDNKNFVILIKKFILFDSIGLNVLLNQLFVTV